LKSGISGKSLLLKQIGEAMHIPQSILQGSICPLTVAVSVVGLGIAGYACRKSNDNVPPLRWAGVSALIFVLQMLNFPITQGTSGHLIGGVLAASLIGIPRAVLSMALIIISQALFFADGGTNAIGANILNMALIATGMGGFLYHSLVKHGLSKTNSLAMTSLLSVLLATLACSLEVAYPGPISFGAMLKAMLPVHILIGMGEVGLTVVLYHILCPKPGLNQEKPQINRLIICSLAALALVPFSSGFPDGLEWVSKQLNLTYSNSGSLLAWFKDYEIPAIKAPYFSKLGASLIGLALVWLTTMSMAKRIGNRVHLG
jgi:cobalt/nickel transport system permease protein